jgi:mRNA interferase RelE/StbE
MTYDVIFSDKAYKQLKKLDRETQSRIIAALERIRIRPERHITKLIGDPGYKMRIGDFRIILDIDHNTLRILVIKIGHRKKVYKE